jgi:hypothetical protein
MKKRPLVKLALDRIRKGLIRAFKKDNQADACRSLVRLYKTCGNDDFRFAFFWLLLQFYWARVKNPSSPETAPPEARP